MKKLYYRRLVGKKDMKWHVYYDYNFVKMYVLKKNY